MLPATLLVALMLQSLALLSFPDRRLLDFDLTNPGPLTVLLNYAADQRAKSEDSEPLASGERDEHPRHDVADEMLAPASPEEAMMDDSLDPRVNTARTAEVVQTEVPVDWQALAESSAAEFLESEATKEALREAMWRKTGSVLFKAGDDAPLNLNAQLLPDYRFRNPVGVLGLGLSFGQCFVGIPLAGIPVENRTAAITIFYCRE